MLHACKKTLFLFLSVLLLTACGIQQTPEGYSADDQKSSHSTNITSIADLHDITYFRDGALVHIFEGEVDGHGDAVGFHFDGLPTKKGNVIQGTETNPNGFGVYEAEVEVDGITKASNGGKSTFFPKEWDAQQVVDAINQAYDEKTMVSGNTYEGLTSDGIVIRMYLDKQDSIISAFPIY